MLCKLSAPEPVVPGRAERWDTAKVFREVGEMAGLAGAGEGSRELLGGLVGEDLEGLKGLGVALLERYGRGADLLGAVGFEGGI
jgi:hypothetical protein